MVGALVLVNTEAGIMEKVFERILSLERVEKAKMLTGPYDIMAEVEGESMEEIVQTAINKIRKIEGVTETTTCVHIDSKLSEGMAEVLKESKEYF